MKDRTENVYYEDPVYICIHSAQVSMNQNNRGSLMSLA